MNINNHLSLEKLIYSGEEILNLNLLYLLLEILGELFLKLGSKKFIKSAGKF